MRILKISVLIITVALLMPIFATALDKEPSDFNGIRWGSNRDRIAGLQYEYDDMTPYQQKTVFYSRKGDKKKLYGINVDDVLYEFYNDKFIMGRALASGEDKFELLKANLVKKHGKWSKSENNPTTFTDEKTKAPIKGTYEWYEWHGENILIMLDYQTPKAAISLRMVSKKVCNKEGLR